MSTQQHDSHTTVLTDCLEDALNVQSFTLIVPPNPYEPPRRESIKRHLIRLLIAAAALSVVRSVTEPVIRDRILNALRRAYQHGKRPATPQQLEQDILDVQTLHSQAYQQRHIACMRYQNARAMQKKTGASRDDQGQLQNVLRTAHYNYIKAIEIEIATESAERALTVARHAANQSITGQDMTWNAIYRLADLYDMENLINALVKRIRCAHGQ